MNQIMNQNMGGIAAVVSPVTVASTASIAGSDTAIPRKKHAKATNHTGRKPALNSCEIHHF